MKRDRDEEYDWGEAALAGVVFVVLLVLLFLLLALVSPEVSA